MGNGRRLLLALGLLLLAATSAAAQPAHSVAHLVRDLVPGSDHLGGDSHPGWLTPFGSKVAFIATQESIGREVWISDGETRRTDSLGDICRGSCTGPIMVGSLGSTLFFTENRVEYGARLLFASDGTARGTRPVSDDLDVLDSALLPGRLVFVAAQGTELKLWRTDATAAGATEVAALNNPFVDEARLLVSGNRAFLVLRHSTTIEVWSTDGTTGGTRKLADLQSGFQARQLYSATATHVFVVVATRSGGQELWASDGTVAGTRVVSSFAAPEPFELTFWLKPIGKHVYFIADDVTHGRELWRSDGTSKGTTRVTDFGDARPFHELVDDELVEVVNGKIVFVADGGVGPPALWTSTGSPASTQPLGVCSDPCSLADEPWLRRLGNRLFFPAYSPPRFANELWSTDGTAAGSGPLLGPCSDACVEHVFAPVVVGDRLYFVANGPTGQELWSSDGTAAGTRAVSDFEDSDAFDTFPGFILEIVAAAGRVWFPAEQSPYGEELWSSAGTPETTELAGDVNRGAGGSNPVSFAAFGDRVLFLAANCAAGGYDPWVSDGGASTQRLSPLVPDCFFGFPDELPIVVSGAYGYFWRDDFDVTLWRTDGTPGGTMALATFPDLSFGTSLLAVDGGVVFFGGDGLWMSDGTVAGTAKKLEGTGLTSDWFADGQILYVLAQEPGANRQIWRVDLSNGAVVPLTAFGADSPLAKAPPSFTKLGGHLYFWLHPAGESLALWRTDGTPAGTEVRFDLPADADDEILSMSSAAGALYFHIGLSPTSYQLWRTDGSPAGANQLGTFSTLDLQDPFPAFDVAEAGGRVLFVGGDAAHGRELWSTDGTRQGTSVLRDVFPGTGSSLPTELTAAGGRVFFTAGDATHGRELWQSDGTEAGTRLVHDIAPDAISGDPTGLTVAGSTLFFAADDGLVGRELWALPLAGTGTCVASDTVLCVGGGRFRVEAVWRDFARNTGSGHAAALTADTGTFWFFSPSNVEVILKVLDGRGVNGHQWVFYGALSSVEYTLTVTDTQTGAVRRYFNPAGRLASVGDTDAFGPRGAAAARKQARLAREPSPAPLVAERRDAAAKALCETSATRLCLAGGRFAVEVAWRDFAGGTGAGAATALTSDTGHFWFFSPSNVELVVKVLDGRPVNGKFWLFYGALSSVGYTLTVTDTQTGTTRTYTNPSGRLASVADTSAF